MNERWKQVPKWRQTPPAATLRHSQILSSYGPGALVDFVNDAAIIAGLSYWAKGDPITEERLRSVLRRQGGFENVELFSLPESSQELDDPLRKWIRAFRFPQWFVCSNENCWKDSGKRADRAGGHRPRRLLHSYGLVNGEHRCGGSVTSPVLAVRFVRACRKGHVDNLTWGEFVHGGRPCDHMQLWIEETGASGDLADVWVFCDCGKRVSMALAANQRAGEVLGVCSGRRPWLGDRDGMEQACDEPSKLLLRSASHAYFPVSVSVLHIPDMTSELRAAVTRVWERIKEVEDVGDVQSLRKLLKVDVGAILSDFTNEDVLAEVVRRRDLQSAPAKKSVKELELEVLLRCPPELTTDRPEGRFYARTRSHPSKQQTLSQKLGSVVLLHRMTEVRAQVGFTRFEAQGTDIDGELELGVEVARLDEPNSWVPTVEHHGEGFFFSLSEDALAAWEQRPSVRDRAKRFEQSVQRWLSERPGRDRRQKRLASPRFVLLHSLSHLLLTAVALECGYATSAIRERIYVGDEGCGILLYTATPGSEGSLGGVVEVGRHLERYLVSALEQGRLCANDPLCAAHAPDAENDSGERYLEGAACHGCLLISETSCERRNQFLDRTLVVPTVEQADAAFFERW